MNGQNFRFPSYPQGSYSPDQPSQFGQAQNYYQVPLHFVVIFSSRKASSCQSDNLHVWFPQGGYNPEAAGPSYQQDYSQQGFIPNQYAPSASGGPMPGQHAQVGPTWWLPESPYTLLVLPCE